MNHEEALKEAELAQTNVRSLVVAAGILTEQEAAEYLYVRLSSRAELPPGVVVEPCCSGCGHDMSDAPIMRFGIKDVIGVEKRDAILALLESAQAEN